MMSIEINQLMSRFFYSSTKSAPTEEISARFDAQLRALGLDWGMMSQMLYMPYRLVFGHHGIFYSARGETLHSHDFFELLYCCNSCGMEYLAGTGRYPFQQGDILFLPPGTAHRPILPQTLPTPSHRDVLWLSGEFMTHLKTRFIAFQDISTTESFLLHTRGIPEEGIIRELFRVGAMRAEHLEPRWEEYLESSCETLLLLMEQPMRDHTLRGGPLRRQELLDQVILFVEDHLTESFSISDAAQALWVSESTVSHTFQRGMGISFGRYVTQRRLIAAKERILAGVPLTSVCEQVGFADYSTFYRAIRREYGLSPRDYKLLVEMVELPAANGPQTLRIQAKPPAPAI